MRVIAAEHPVPLLPDTDNPEGGFIQPAPDDPVEVPEHSYYLRRLATGELLRADDIPAPVAESVDASGSAKTTAKTRKAVQTDNATTEDTAQ